MPSYKTQLPTVSRIPKFDLLGSISVVHVSYFSRQQIIVSLLSCYLDKLLRAPNIFIFLFLYISIKFVMKIVKLKSLFREYETELVRN